ncbi:MAG TPA: C39 family peptidase [Deltaproteobacteria bacterium]|jgi:hypothetical protein|nr:C39 family peptidase [Deltaproteobacteria bacterium]
MRRTGNTGLIIAAAFMMIGLTMTAFDAHAVQPYQDPAFEEVGQGSAQCGPTSFYMVFNHLRAHQVFKEVNLSEHPEDMAAYGYKVTKNTAICKWVNGGSTSGTSWTKLRAAADKLHAQGTTAAYFKTELNSSTTAYNSATAEAEREKRLNYIKANYLDKNRPVIIHLRRSSYLSGHYVVVTGYDTASGKVYYADPNGPGSGEVSKTSFIKDKWYVSPDNSASYYRARWDGEWMGFYHDAAGTSPGGGIDEDPGDPDDTPDDSPSYSFWDFLIRLLTR